MGMIYIIRHGQTYWNLSKRLQGQKNSALTTQGEEQTKTIATYFKNRKIHKIYASSLGRARQTARIIALHIGLEKKHIFTIRSLSEMNFGSLEGKLESEITVEIEKFLADRANYKFPRGENYESVYTRVVPVIQDIRRKNLKANALIVGHQAVNRAILGALLDIPKEKFAQIDHLHHLIYIFDTKTKKMYVYDVNRKKKGRFYF